MLKHREGGFVYDDDDDCGYVYHPGQFYINEGRRKAIDYLSELKTFEYLLKDRKGYRSLPLRLVQELREALRFRPERTWLDERDFDEFNWATPRLIEDIKGTLGRMQYLSDQPINTPFAVLANMLKKEDTVK